VFTTRAMPYMSHEPLNRCSTRVTPHLILAAETMTLGLANSSLNLWLCSSNLLSLSSCIVTLLLRAGMVCLEAE
jgi:hypothetical protein